MQPAAKTTSDAGGMGEVYRAQDTQLRRPVALKLLPAWDHHGLCPSDLRLHESSLDKMRSEELPLGKAGAQNAPLQTETNRFG